MLEPLLEATAALRGEPGSVRLVEFWRRIAPSSRRSSASTCSSSASRRSPRSLVGVPLGILAARRPRLGAPLVWLANAAQTIPSLAMFGFLLPLPFIGGLGARVAITVLIVYALLPIVRTTVAGITSVDPALVEAGTALGMTPRQLLRQVELPLALPSIVAGIRVAAVIGVGTATIAAAVGAGGLGEYIFRGLSMVEPTVILAGAIPAALLALTLDGGLTLAERGVRGALDRRWTSGDARLAGGWRRGRRDRRPVALSLAGRAGRRRSGSARRTSPSRSSSARSSRRRIESRAGAAGRAPPEPRRHVHLRPRASAPATSTSTSSTPAPRTPRSSSSRPRPIPRRSSTAVRATLRRRRPDAARAARLREHVRDPRPRRRRAGGSGCGPSRMRRRTAASWQAGFGYEFLQRADGYPGLAQAYGLQFGTPPRAMDLSLIYRALAERQVDLIAGDATSGLIEAYGLVMLEDDRRYFPPYDAVVVARSAALLAHPALQAGARASARPHLARRHAADEPRRRRRAPGPGGRGARVSSRAAAADTVAARPALNQTCSVWRMIKGWPRRIRSTRAPR